MIDASDDPPVTSKSQDRLASVTTATSPVMNSCAPYARRMSDIDVILIAIAAYCLFAWFEYIVSLSPRLVRFTAYRKLELGPSDELHPGANEE